jgi:hypothetical protein
MLKVVPLTLREANSFVASHHRHNKPSSGCKFAIGAVDKTGELVGVAVAGRPVARLLDDGKTIEVTRVATNGSPNVNSFLYGKVRRVAQAMGYQKIITYTLKSEGGESMRAIGAVPVADSGKKKWDRPSRSRQDQPVYAEPKTRWELPMVTQ